MSWTDKKSIEHIKKIRDEFDIREFVETGTFKGINAEVQSKNFQKVLTCEIVPEYLKAADKRLKKCKNVRIFKKNSPEFLKQYIERDFKKDRKDTIFIYLDAHFYDPKLDPKDRFIILKELESLKGFKNCVICIHDFDNNLGHITYDGQSLNMELLRESLYNVNPNFHFYTNELSSCEIMKVKEATDEEMKDNLQYAWMKPEKTFRGILYCTPFPIEIEGLREWN